jgi:hypothetical protein
MKIITAALVFLTMAALGSNFANAQEVPGMYYLLPIEHVTEWPPGSGNPTDARGPMYFSWRFNEAGIDTKWSMMDYGFVDTALLYAPDISQADHDFLALQSDVYAFPVDLDTPVDGQEAGPIFEGFNLPTDWLTPATTNRELMRQTAGMMQFNQRYSGISGGGSIFDNADLSTRLRQMTAEEEEWFYLTSESFGIDRSLINRNSQLRLLIRQAGDIWAGQPFLLGGVEF